jgi:hypothetical protein
LNFINLSPGMVSCRDVLVAWGRRVQGLLMPTPHHAYGPYFSKRLLIQKERKKRVREKVWETDHSSYVAAGVGADTNEGAVAA